MGGIAWMVNQREQTFDLYFVGWISDTQHTHIYATLKVSPTHTHTSVNGKGGKIYRGGGVNTGVLVEQIPFPSGSFLGSEAKLAGRHILAKGFFLLWHVFGQLKLMQLTCM